jgi:uncharacterized protein
MSRRLMHALCALLLSMTVAAPGAAAAVHAPVSGGHAPFHAQEEAPAEDELATFNMPGLTPDNLTQSVLADLDAYWSAELGAGGLDYYAAATTPVSEMVYTGCGQFGPYDNPAAFCPLDDTVYYSVQLAQDIQATVGDFAWITVLAHEWGHHVQLVLGIEPELTIDRELQADCLAGSYAQRALQQGFLQEGDLTEAMVISILSADPIEMGETVDGAHGSGDYRVTSFMEGYFNGSSACLSI